jgi:hypothetical protein
MKAASFGSIFSSRMATLSGGGVFGIEYVCASVEQGKYANKTLPQAIAIRNTLMILCMMAFLRGVNT